jgi:hypothetical protein
MYRPTTGPHIEEFIDEDERTMRAKTLELIPNHQKVSVTN